MEYLKRKIPKLEFTCFLLQSYCRTPAAGANWSSTKPSLDTLNAPDCKRRKTNSISQKSQNHIKIISNAVSWHKTKTEFLTVNKIKSQLNIHLKA